MTGRSSAKRTSLCLLALLLSCLSSENLLFVVGEPVPITPELYYSESLINSAENLMLWNRLNQLIEEKKDMAEKEKALDNEQMAIESVLEEAKAKTKTRLGDYSVGKLPMPNAVVSRTQHPGKRTAISYMTLCHFKICNMGRKRQLHN